MKINKPTRAMSKKAMIPMNVQDEKNSMCRISLNEPKNQDPRRIVPEQLHGASSDLGPAEPTTFA